MSKILLIGDPHAHPDYDNDRFEWLGKFAVSAKPDHIVVMGDWGDIPSLSFHGKPLDREGARLSRDKEALHDSLRRFEEPIQKYNEQMRERKRRTYRPNKIYILGNHENRIAKYEADHPELQGELTQEWLAPFQEARWTLVPFGQTYELEGYEICHYQPSGTMGRPIGGKTGSALAQRLLGRHVSSIVGHDHRYGIASERVGDTKRRIWGINTGCFVHPDYIEDWCRQTRSMWDLGVVVLDGAKNGDHTRHIWISQTELQRRYGAKECR